MRNTSKSKTIKDKSHYFRLLFFLFLCVLGLLFYIWQRFEAVNIGYKIHDVNKKISSLELEVTRLELEKNKLGSYTRIESYAKEKLGMKTPEPKDIVIINVDKS
jgi:cell division protein FtsL